MAVQEEGKQAPVKLNKEASGKVTRLRTQKGVSIDSTNKKKTVKTGW